MQIAAILLIASFLGILGMVGRKIFLVKKGHIEIIFGPLANPFLEDLTKLRYLSRKSAKRYAYATLFAVLRLYIRSANFLKRKSLALAYKIERRLLKNRAGVSAENGEKREASRYLKMISEYQRKIRKMKEKIREEESLEDN